MPMSLSTITSTVSPDLIAATVAAIPPIAIKQSNQLHTIIGMACSTASNQDEAICLLIRMRAAAILFRDEQWLDCISSIRVNALSQLAMIDGIILELIATQPLDATLHFDTDDFCNAMRDRMDARRRDCPPVRPKGCSDLTKRTAPGLFRSRPREPPVG